MRGKKCNRIFGLFTKRELRNTFCNNEGLRGVAVGCGTALPVGRSRARFPMMSLEFFINIILPVALLVLTQPLTEMSTRDISWGVKAAGA